MLIQAAAAPQQILCTVLASRQASQSSILSSELSKKPEVSFTRGPNLEHETWIMKSKQDWPRCLQQCRLVFSTIPACRIEETGRGREERRRGYEKEGRGKKKAKLFISKYTFNNPLFSFIITLQCQGFITFTPMFRSASEHNLWRERKICV